jgi:hypothetical protein
MQMSTYVTRLQRELAAAAGPEAGSPIAERLISALDAAAHLALLEALSDAAEEITGELAPGSVEVRLRGRDPEFVVVPPPTATLEEPVGLAKPVAAEPDEAATPRPWWATARA